MTLCVDNMMFNLVKSSIHFIISSLNPLQCFFLCSFHYFPLSGSFLSSRQHAKREGKALMCFKQVNPCGVLGKRELLHFGEDGWWWWGGGYGYVNSSSCQWTVYTTVLLGPMAFFLRALMAYSPRLIPFSSFRCGFLQTNTTYVDWNWTVSSLHSKTQS